MALTYQELEDAARGRGYTLEYRGTPSCPYFGITFPNGVIGVSDETVCAYTHESWDGGTEEISSWLIPVDATTQDVMVKVADMGTSPF